LNANATQTNVTGRPLDDTVTWVGLLDFRIGPGTGSTVTTISDFFDSGTGTVISGLGSTVGGSILSGGAGNGDSGGLADTDSGNGTTFRETTLFQITALSFDNISDMSQIIQVTHDDGFTLTDGSATVDDPGPTTETDTLISGLSGGPGSFDLIYAAANGDPSVLEVSVVPLPAAAWLLMFASGGLVAAKRRQSKKVA